MNSFDDHEVIVVWSVMVKLDEGEQLVWLYKVRVAREVRNHVFCDVRVELWGRKDQ